MIIRIFMLLLWTLEAFCVFAQKDTIWLLNGEYILTSHYNLNIEDGFLTYQDKRNKLKTLDLGYVFSVVDSNQKEKIIFESTTIGRTYYTVEQMRSFIQGEHAAHKYFRAPFSTVSGVLTGAGGVYFFPLALHLNVFFAPLIPAANTAIIGSFNYKEEKVKQKYPAKTDDNYFIAGYREIATQKRINNSIKGGILGLGLGVVSAIVINNLMK